jgi:hypothetical protein
MKFIRVGKVFGIVHNAPERGAHSGLMLDMRCEEGDTFPGIYLPEMVIPSGGVIRGRKEGTGLHIRRPSWTTASRYGSIETALLVISSAVLKRERTSVQSWSHVLRLERR